MRCGEGGKGTFVSLGVRDALVWGACVKLSFITTESTNPRFVVVTAPYHSIVALLLLGRMGATLKVNWL